MPVYSNSPMNDRTQTDSHTFAGFPPRPRPAKAQCRQRHSVEPTPERGCFHRTEIPLSRLQAELCCAALRHWCGQKRCYIAAKPLHQEALHQSVGSEETKQRRRKRHEVPGATRTASFAFVPRAIDRHYICPWIAWRVCKNMAERTGPSFLLAPVLVADGAGVPQREHPQLWVRCRLGKQQG